MKFCSERWRSPIEEVSAQLEPSIGRQPAESKDDSAVPVRWPPAMGSTSDLSAIRKLAQNGLLGDYSPKVGMAADKILDAWAFFGTYAQLIGCRQTDSRVSPTFDLSARLKQVQARIVRRPRFAAL